MPLGASSALLSYFPTGLSKNGTLVLMAGIDKIEVSPMQLIATRRRIIGWPAGTGRDSQVRCLILVEGTGWGLHIRRGRWPFG